MTAERQDDTEVRQRQRAGVRRVAWICAGVAALLYIGFIVKMVWLAH